MKIETYEKVRALFLVIALIGFILIYFTR